LCLSKPMNKPNMSSSPLDQELVRVATEATLLARQSGAVGRSMARRRATRYGTQAVAYVVLSQASGWYGLVTLDARGKVLAALDARVRLGAIAESLRVHLPSDNTAMVVVCPNPCARGVVADALRDTPLWLVDAHELLLRATGLREPTVAHRTLLGWNPLGNHLAHAAGMVLHADVWPHVDAVARRAGDVATQTQFEGPDLFEAVSRAVCAATGAEVTVTAAQLRREYAQRIRAAGHAYLGEMHDAGLHRGVTTVAALAKRALRTRETARLARTQAFTREPGTRLFNYMPGPVWPGDVVPARAIAARVGARVVQTYRRAGRTTTVHEAEPAGDGAELVLFINADHTDTGAGEPPRMTYQVRADHQ